MIVETLKTAMDESCEVIILNKSNYEPLQGKILEINECFCKLFHSGRDGGILWVIKLEEVSSCGLILDVPDIGQNNNEKNEEENAPRSPESNQKNKKHYP